MAARGTGLLITGSVLAGLGLASIFPISVSLLPSWFGESANRASGAAFASGNTGGAILPWVVGAVSTDVQSGQATMCYLPGMETPERECWYINMGAVDRNFFTVDAMVQAGQ